MLGQHAIIYRDGKSCRDPAKEALQIAKRRDKLPIGVIYRTEKPVFHNELYGDHNPITKRMLKADRIAKLREILEVR